MHQALCLDEILLNIFGHCHPADSSSIAERSHSTADLAALARTCRTFKDPALDVLWSELIDLSPLAFCLPEGGRSSRASRRYVFTKPRNKAEWDILRSYTRRIWRITSFSSPRGYLDHTCISVTFNPPLAEPLFPNLRYLVWKGGAASLPITNFAVPRLTSLDIRGTPREDASLYTIFLDTIVSRCPNIKKVRIQVANNRAFGETVSRHLCHWKNLQIADCLDVSLPVDVIPPLSRIPTLTWLSFTLNARSPNPIPDLSSTLVFSRLVYLEIVSELLDSVTSLITHVQLPVVQVLIVPFPSCPSKATAMSYLTTISRVCSSNSLKDLRLLNLRSFAAHVSSSINYTLHDYRLVLDDIRPCMTFSNLRTIHINLEWSIGLTDNDLLHLVSAWPNIEHILINDQWGWRTSTGITLDGLLRVLQKCKSLWELCVAIDTQTPSSIEGSDIDLSSRSQIWLNVADSPIQPESVSALGAVFSALGVSYEHCSAWNGSEMRDLPGAGHFRSLWMSVFS